MEDQKTDVSNSSSSSTSAHLLAGAAAGLCADFITHPIDTIRTRLQVQRASGIGNTSVIYKGTIHAFGNIVKNEGFSALYKGFGIVFVSTTPAHALYFAGYEMAKKTLRPSKAEDEKGPLVHFAAGLWADICGSFIWVPMDVVKQRLQIQRSKEGQKYRNSFHALKTIATEEGFRGLFKGYGAAVATYGPFVAIYFTAYEQFKLLFKKALNIQNEEDVPFYAQLCSGALGGAFAATVTCPMDVIKTRLQVESSKGTNNYKNAFDAMRRIMKEEGIRAFGKGMSARILWIAPGTAITIALYEQFKSVVSKLD